MKWLIVTADDFGITSGINRGIIQAHREGILTSTSLMVDRPACEQAAALGRACGTLSVGLHLELDPGKPERIHEEIERQLGRFFQLAGARPTHVDSHHDVHYDPRVLPHVLAWSERIGAPVRGYSRARHFSKFYGQWGSASRTGRRREPSSDVRPRSPRRGDRVDLSSRLRRTRISFELRHGAGGGAANAL